MINCFLSVLATVIMGLVAVYVGSFFSEETEGAFYFLMGGVFVLIYSWLEEMSK